ncbi:MULTISPECIES: hypothetical protein [Kaistia]|uniref:Uncharacterized protein n=1 Tax=Kaistia nematophila TaxID=2994654 RepID=A0A9X3E6S4_9HYPH|nr:hypothetical protein [Kaistia nematophila]MCX5570613.1 hypothetical protein [Kaistia nematophila]
MKVRMLVSLAGSHFALSRGDETDRFDEVQAARLIEAAYAVAVEPTAGGAVPGPVSAADVEPVQIEPSAGEALDDEGAAASTPAELAETEGQVATAAVESGVAPVADERDGSAADADSGASEPAQPALALPAEIEPQAGGEASEKAGSPRKRRG